MKRIVAIGFLMCLPMAAHAEYLGRLSRNPYYADSCSNPYSRCGNRFDALSPRNQFGPYGNRFSPYSTGPFGQGLRVYGNAAPDEPSTYDDPYGLYDDYGEYE